MIATTGDQEKLAKCREIGADRAVSYRVSCAADVVAAIGSDAVDVVLDVQAGHYTQAQLQHHSPWTGEWC